MRKILSIIALFASITASADDFSLYYDLSSGIKNKEVSAVSNLQKLVFDKDGNMIVYKKDGKTETIALSGVSRIFFSTPGSVDIKSTSAEDNKIPANAKVYDLMGRQVKADLSTDRLPKGIYIINGKKTSVR